MSAYTEAFDGMQLTRRHRITTVLAAAGHLARQQGERTQIETEREKGERFEWKWGKLIVDMTISNRAYSATKTIPHFEMRVTYEELEVIFQDGTELRLYMFGPWEKILCDAFGTGLSLFDKAA